MGCVQPVGRYGSNDCLTIYCGSYEFATMVAVQLDNESESDLTGVATMVAV